MPNSTKKGRRRHHLTEKVELLWAAGDPGRKAEEIQQWVNAKCPPGLDLIKLRTVQHILQGLKKNLAEKSRTPWSTWKNGTTPHLSTLNLISTRIFHRPLYLDEAEWAERLEEFMGDMDLLVQLIVVREYSTRDRIESVRSQLDSPTSLTEDLDQYFAHRPWEDGARLWSAAIHHPDVKLFSLDFRGAQDTYVRDIELAASRSFHIWVKHSLGVLKDGINRPHPSTLTWRDFVRGSYEGKNTEEIAAGWAGVDPDIGSLE
jgi:hypothetical protein